MFGGALLPNLHFITLLQSTINSTFAVSRPLPEIAVPHAPSTYLCSLIVQELSGKELNLESIFIIQRKEIVT